MRKTKIVCTLGPATDREGVLRQMLEAGMNVARFNFSHGSHAEHKGRLDALKALRAELGGGWQMVVANIVADVIIGLSPLVRPMLAPGGLFLCSGIIDDRAQEVADRLRENGWEILETRSAEGWFSYLCR